MSEVEGDNTHYQSVVIVYDTATQINTNRSDIKR